MTRSAITFVATVVLACQTYTVGSIRSQPFDHGPVRHYATDLRSAVQACRTAVVAAGDELDVEEVRQVDERTWYLIVRGANEVFRMVAQEVADGEVAIRVLTRSGIVGRRDWSEELFELLAIDLAEIQRDHRAGQTPEDH